MTIDSTGSLNINSLDTDDRGSYFCQISNEIGQAKQQFQIDVYGKIHFDHTELILVRFLEPPLLTDKSQETELDANVDKSFLLPCPVTAHPRPTILWFRQNQLIDRKYFSSKAKSIFRFADNQDAHTYLHSNGSLEIRMISTNDNDRYHCTATNPAGTVTHSVQLHVNVPPWIIGAEKETNVEAKIGKSLTLVCPAVGTPKPTIQWFKNDDKLPAFDINDQYVLTNIKQSDQGIYRCLATNKAGRAQRLFNLSVHSKSNFLPREFLF